MNNEHELNFCGEKFPSLEDIESQMKNLVEKLQSNFSDVLYDPKALNHKKNESFIAVRDIQNNNTSATILRSFFKNMGVEPNNTDKGKTEYSGIYVFAEKTASGYNPIYTGISRAAITRIKEHVNRGDRATATWAALIAKDQHPDLKELDKMAYKSFKNDPEMKKRKEELIKILNAEIIEVQAKKMSKYFVTFVPENNNFVMHISEAYIACALKCKWNTFKTH